MQRLFVEEDRIVVDAGVAQQRRQFGPDLVVTLLVLGDVAGLELHAERVIRSGTHRPASDSTTTDFAGSVTLIVSPDARAPSNAAGSMVFGFANVLCASSAADVSTRPASFFIVVPAT